MVPSPPPPVELPRHLTLDALRGIAVMGILAMNIIAFAMPEQAYLNPLAWGGSDPADLALWAVSMVMVDGKMRGLFSLLFGASMLLVIERAEAKGESPARVHYRRMGWLMLFGLAHYYLIWFGDILFLYAVVGMAAYPLRDRAPGALIRMGIACIAASFLILALSAATFLFLEHAAGLPGARPEIVASYRDTLNGIGAPGSATIGQEVAVYRGDYAGILALRFAAGPFTGLMFTGFETLGFMLIGMALLKNGFLTGGWAPARYRRVAGIAYLWGLPPVIALCAWCFASGFEPITTFNAVFAWALPFRLVLVIGHAALALWIVTTQRERAWVRRVAAAGRVAFTNYLGTSVVMTTLFYGYGLGLFGSLSRLELIPFVLGGWAVILWWSKPWLERFAYGPMEWLWRSLARRRIQPMRR